MIQAQTGALGQRKECTFKGNGNAGRHGWLRLTPAYSLHVVRELLADVSQGEKVLDPFSGTGTTPLVCAAFAIECHSVDINPFLVWLGNVKLHPFSPRQVRQFQEAAAAVSAASQETAATQGHLWLPGIHQIEKWWDTKHLNALGSLCASIHSANCPTPVKNLLKLSFCKVMIGFAHVSFGHQSMSFKQRRAKAMLFDVAPDVASAFFEAAADIAQSLAAPFENARCKVVLGDSRDLRAALSDRDYTRVVTSPPYPNRMSYIRELRPYMYWLGFLENGRQAGELDWQAIGGTWGCATSLLKNWRPEHERPISYPRFAEIVEEIGRRHSLLGAYVHKYFYDMRCHLESLRDVLACGARCHYVVGNSKFYDTLLPTQEIFAALFENCGFRSVTITTLRKRTSKRELYEYVVEAVKGA